MARLRQEIEAMFTSMEQYEDQREELHQLHESMEQTLIVLEGLEVSADELGTYMQSGKSSDTVTSKALMKKATKWMEEADGISQGKDDLAPISVNTTTSWESISLEDLDDTERKGFFRRLWDSIVRIIRTIWKAITQFFSSNNRANMVLEHKIGTVEEKLHEAEGKQASGHKVKLPVSIARHFIGHEGKLSSPETMVDMLHYSEHVLSTLSSAYVKLAEHSMSDVKNTLQKAFEVDFRSGKEVDDLCLALAAFDVRRVEGGLGGLVGGKPARNVTMPAESKVEGEEFEYRHTKPLVGAQVLIFRTLKQGLWSRITNYKAMNRINAICSNEIQIGHINHERSEEIEVDVMQLASIKRIVAIARDSLNTSKANQASVTHYQDLHGGLLQQIHKCIDEAESNPSKYSEEAGRILSRLSTVTTRRLTPMVHMQSAVSGASRALVALCEEHLALYR